MQHFPMEETREPAGLRAQTSALMRKNLIIQKQNGRANMMLVLLPALVCLLFFLLQKRFDKYAESQNAMMEASPADLAQMQYANAHPAKLSVLFQIPTPESRAARGANTSDPNNHADLPPDSCRANGKCPVSILITGSNRSLAQSLGNNLYVNANFTEAVPYLDIYTAASEFILGTYTDSPTDSLIKPDYTPLYVIQQRCTTDFAFRVSMKINGIKYSKDVKCLEGLSLWREQYSDIIHEISAGNPTDNPNGKINKFLGAYDFLNTNEKNFNITVWYNATKQGVDENQATTQILRAINAVSNSYLRVLRGSNVRMLLDFIKDTPKGVNATDLLLNLESMITPMRSLLFMWIIQSLVPIMLTSLVYEKQKNLRMIMKMHGLGDFPYWVITYAYFLLISSAYVLSLVAFGSFLGLKVFALNDYSVQLVFFLLYTNVQIAVTMVLSTFFSDVKTASVIGQIYVFATGLVSFMLNVFWDDPSMVIKALQTIPSFALSRGLYEFSQYSLQAEYQGEICSNWKTIANDKEGLFSTLIIMIIEWPILLLIGYYLDQVGSNGSGVRKHPLWFLKCSERRAMRYEQMQGEDTSLSMEKSDVCQEREKVGMLLKESDRSHIIICDDLKKKYPPRDGNPAKYAVQGMSLAVDKGECFGMLGPNGAGKTSFISMMTGLTAPTAGAAFVEGLDIREDMDKVYTRMGVCPQHDLLWEVLTGREHLLFYGRLKNLRGAELMLCVEESLMSVNLLEKGGTRAGQYSGGMKRRLSVAISLIGNPKAVYLDEPSTGLDPASRKSLWSAVRHAKKDKAIILTTHSMEEAEYLCDRVGIFVDGSLRCLGHPKELKRRYGGYFLLTITSASNQELGVENLVHRLSPSATKVYHISGTQKFHLLKEEVRVADIFRQVEKAKKRLNIQDWGLADATLEDVFIAVANDALSIS